MKENSESINHILFNQFSGVVAGRFFQNLVQQARSQLLHLARKFLPSIVATLVIGAVFFIGISLFLYQLAEHGW
ncbi:MAG: hypothetical protein KJ630_06980 [Proteobacteria bacterium]|nr:hypothetical protein [Pseudomonadota bacterium]